jgi:aminoglycoside phosphotransferase (APT) family kinase protein
MFLMYWGDPSEAPIPLLTAPTHLPGFASGGDLVERWERATGMPADHLDYFVAFSLWRLAVILLGVERRGREGAYGNAVEPARAVLAGAVPGLLERADRLLTRKQTPRQGSRS